MRCGACCFLRGICVLRECSVIRAASRFSSPSTANRLVPKKSQAVGSGEKVSFEYLLLSDKSRFLLRSRTCGHPTGTCPDDHYLMVIADDPLVVSDAILAIVVILGHLCTLRRYVHTQTDREATAHLSNLGARSVNDEVPRIFSPLFPSLPRNHLYARRHFGSPIGGWWFASTYRRLNESLSGCIVTTFSTDVIALWFAGNSRSRGTGSIYSCTNPWLTTFLCKQSSVSLPSLSRSVAVFTTRCPTTAIGIAPRDISRIEEEGQGESR